MKSGLVFAALAAAFFAVSADAKPFKTHSKSKYLDLEYSWSAEVNAIPALVKRFTADLRKQQASLTAAAEKDAAERKKQGFPFDAYSLVTNVETAGETARLLSLRIDTYRFTGGAHGNSGTKGLIWDRRLGKEIGLDALSDRNSGLLMTFRTAYCRALDAERTKRRQGEKLGGEFDKCPAFSELTVIPADSNHNGRFDRLLFVADPYVAGPYAEGEYEIALPISSTQRSKLKPSYRPSFGN